MKLDPKMLAAGQRQFLPLFLMKAFETLHPGDPPLDLSWYLHAICHRLSEVRSGAERRLVVTVPPRHLKSITASVAFVAWVLGHDPKAKIMVASYSQDLARHHSNQTRMIMESDWYKKLFPRTRISDRGNRALELETTAGGVRKAVSVGGSITGFGADYIIVDDCMKADEAKSAVERQNLRDWFDNTLLSRLNDKATGRIISIQQRLHEDDLPAYMLEKNYSHLNLPAIAEKEERIAIGPDRYHRRVSGDLLNPSRENSETLEQLRRDLGPVVFSAQYQQEPVVPGGNMIRLEWFGAYDEMPERHEFLKVVQSWDTGMTAAPTSDYSVCTTWGFHKDTQKWYLIDVMRRRLDYPDLKKAVVRLWREWSPDRVIIEDAGAGKTLAQDLRIDGPFTPFQWPVRDSKEARLIAASGEIEAGLIFLPRDAPWLEELRQELRAFPNGRHDDQVDSLSQFVEFQKNCWRWTETQYDPRTGRPQNYIRRRYRSR